MDYRKKTEKMIVSTLNKLYKVKQICYSEESNDDFDSLHDDFYWQIQGIRDTLWEAKRMENTEKAYLYYKDEMAHVNASIRDAKTYLKPRKKINWVYG